MRIKCALLLSTVLDTLKLLTLCLNFFFKLTCASFVFKLYLFLVKV